jgi:hypothetical protein
MLITQSAAIREIRARTGLSEESATVRVKHLAKTIGVLDGQRVKVHRSEIERVIAEVNNPPQPKSIVGIRPFSEKKIARIRAFGIAPRRRDRSE